jgi:hypothetical protein
MKIVECLWIDAARVGRWLDEDETVTLQPVATVGWLIEDLDDRVVIAASFCGDDGSYGDAIAVPRGCIKSLVELSPNKGESLLHLMS